ncbi:MAG: hypothetical protein AAFY24_27255, partial [Pseudomonadota bacterium]
SPSGRGDPDCGWFDAGRNFPSAEENEVILSLPGTTLATENLIFEEGRRPVSKDGPLALLLLTILRDARKRAPQDEAEGLGGHGLSDCLLCSLRSR